MAYYLDGTILGQAQLKLIADQRPASSGSLMLLHVLVLSPVMAGAM